MNPVSFVARVCAAFFALALISEPASSQVQRNIARCLSIQNVNQRVDCLEGAGTSPETYQPTSPSTSARALPSFDCGRATHTIERAICGDVTLSELDARMGQQYQQALRVVKPTETQSLVDQQRAWVQQRNAVCSSVVGNVVWSCVLDMTRQRLATLSARPPPETAQAPQPPVSSPTPLAQAPPKNQPIPALSQPSATPTPPEPSTASNSTASAKNSTSEGANPLLVIVFVAAAIVGGIAVLNSVRRRARRQRLVAKYGEQIADMIIARQVWQGMSEEQLAESWGAPVDRDYEVKKAKTKETWKYGQTGKNRFSNRVYLEDGIVVGWKQ